MRDFCFRVETCPSTTTLLLKGPSFFNPDPHPDRAKERLAYVLGRMKEDGVVSAEDKDLALATPPNLVAFEQKRRDYHERLQAAYFASHRIAGTEIYVARRGDSLYRRRRRRPNTTAFRHSAISPMPPTSIISATSIPTRRKAAGWCLASTAPSTALTR